MQPNDYLAVSIHYLRAHRAAWPAGLGVGKTIVSSSMIDRVAAKLAAPLYEVPVGFKYFVDGLAKPSLFFGGEESAGSSFLRRNGRTWTTDKDGLIAGLLAAEITATTGKDPAAYYQSLTASWAALSMRAATTRRMPRRKRRCRPRKRMPSRRRRSPEARSGTSSRKRPAMAMPLAASR